MSATIEQKFEELRHAYEDLRKEHDAALAELQVRAAALGCGNGLDASYKQTADRDSGSLKTENEELRAAQAAGLEVLQTMVASPGDTQPVFDLIARRAAEMCAVPVAAVAMLNGTMLHLATQKGFDPALVSVYASQFPRPVGPDTVMGRTILSRRVEQIEDVDADPAYGMALALGPRSLMGVPLLRNGEPLGVISVGRPVVGRFPDNLAILLQIFAEQAVIAITSAETYRALQARTAALAQRTTEYGERIEQQAATIDVLKVMSASPDDALPVFRLVVERARAFFEADGASLALLQDDMLHLQAYDGSFRLGYEAGFPRRLSRTTMFGRAILARDVVEMPDVSLDPDYYARETPEQVQHAIIAVPLLRAGVPLGAVAIGRRRAGKFSAAEVELLKTFAEQAVIAIGSAATYRALQRRTSDLQESLEYQTATSDVLRVISQSTFDLQPVLDTVAKTASQLCDAEQAAIFQHEDGLLRLVANCGFSPEYEALVRGLGAFPRAPSVRAAPSTSPTSHLYRATGTARSRWVISEPLSACH
jgi:two-component system NtrC family sensor kinase